MIASLPWYDLPEVRSATDAFWRVVAKNLRRHGVKGVPVRLDRRIPVAGQWRRPDLLLSQACGFNIVTDFAQNLKVLATPSYRIIGCGAGTYRSMVIVREESRIQSIEDLRGTSCAINDLSSHSGANALRHLVAPLRRQGRVFASVHVSGAHVASIRAVQSGLADVAAIDCVTFELLRRYRAAAIEGIRCLTYTAAAPAPPYVTSAAHSPDRVRRMVDALLATMEDPGSRACREALMIRGICTVSSSCYEELRGGRGWGANGAAELAAQGA
jgi:ABC-type phosphate/phosphonate transport system substrate-binding protein